jgi:hypothetical protein
MDIRRWRWPAAIVAGLLVIAFLAAPYLTAHRIGAAVRDGDEAALADLVDFPSVRQNLKDRMNAAALARITQGSAGGEDMLTGLGLALAGLFIDKAVDAFVTPAGVARLVSERRIVVQPGRDPATPADTREPFAGAKMSYETFDRFVITVEGGARGAASAHDTAGTAATAGAGGKTGTFVLRRRGLGWKLTEIIVPIV